MSSSRLKAFLKRTLPGPLRRPLITVYRLLTNGEELATMGKFVGSAIPHTNVWTRVSIVHRCVWTSFFVESPHGQHEILSFIRAVLELPDSLTGCVVEAGCYKGSSTAKFSIAASLVGRKLVIFDSFQGMPGNVETHDSDIFGRPISFSEGSYRGALEEARRNVARFGDLEVCEFVEGWFADTMPSFAEPIAAIYVDVDLASSTQTCLKYLYPLLSPGGVLFSQDGHVPLVVDVYQDERFWSDDVGFRKPSVENIGVGKLIWLRKPEAERNPLPSN